MKEQAALCRRIVTVAIIAFFCTSFTFKRVTQQEAIKLAENFIKRNDYTNARVDTSKYKFAYEILDMDLKTTIKMRHNTLHPKAFCISENDSEYHIGFLSSSVSMENLDSMQCNSDLPGRAVIVKIKTGVTRIAHKSPLFSKFNKL